MYSLYQVFCDTTILIWDFIKYVVWNGLILILFPSNEAMLGMIVFLLTMLSIFASQRLQSTSSILTDRNNILIRDYRSADKFVAKHDLLNFNFTLCNTPLAPFLQGKEISGVMVGNLCENNEPRRDIIQQASQYAYSLEETDVCPILSSLEDYKKLMAERFGGLEKINEQGKYITYIESPYLQGKIVFWSNVMYVVQGLASWYALLLGVPPIKRLGNSMKFRNRNNGIQ